MSLLFSVSISVSPLLSSPLSLSVCVHISFPSISHLIPAPSTSLTLFPHSGLSHPSTPSHLTENQPCRFLCLPPSFPLLLFSVSSSATVSTIVFSIRLLLSGFFLFMAGASAPHPALPLCSPCSVYLPLTRVTPFISVSILFSVSLHTLHTSGPAPARGLWAPGSRPETVQAAP